MVDTVVKKGRLTSKHVKNPVIAKVSLKNICLKLLKDKRVKAFLDAIADAEGGGYNIKFGGGKFTDYSTHPGASKGGKITAAGRYQINKGTWKELCLKLDLTYFSPATQDLMGVQLLRECKAIDCITSNSLDGALSHASRPWAALPQGPGLPNR